MYCTIFTPGKLKWNQLRWVRCLGATVNQVVGPLSPKPPKLFLLEVYRGGQKKKSFWPSHISAKFSQPRHRKWIWVPGRKIPKIFLYKQELAAAHHLHVHQNMKSSPVAVRLENTFGIHVASKQLRNFLNGVTHG